jgi:hypothetical protein
LPLGFPIYVAAPRLALFLDSARNDRKGIRAIRCLPAVALVRRRVIQGLFPLLGIRDKLRFSFAHFNLGADFLDLRGLLFYGRS